MAPLDIYIVTFNCGRALVDIDAFSAHLFKPYRDRATDQLPDLVVLCLQEIAPIAYSFLGGSFLSPYFARIAQAVQQAASPQLEYHHVATHNAGMTAIIVFAKPGILTRLQQLATADVGVGHLEMGNKGAAGARLIYCDESGEILTMTFVAAHLAPMEEAVKQRNQDWEDIVKGLVFVNKKSHAREQEDEEPLLSRRSSDTQEASGMFASQSALIFAGDLNYRTSDTRPGKDHHDTFPQASVGNADPKHYSHLLQHDQLAREQKAGKTLHHLYEPSIEFPPTYKYAIDKYVQTSALQEDAAEASAWHWSQHRYPSWCDRILYSSQLSDASESVEVLTYTALPIQPTSDHRPVVLAIRLNTLSASNRLSNVTSPFSINPHFKERRASSRQKEVFVGLVMYFSWTWEGRGLVLATMVGAIGGWLVLRSLVTS